MLFNIEVDDRDLIIGYVVPDDFEKTALLRVSSNGEKVAEIRCGEPRPALVSVGRHATGLCGFVLDRSTLPDLGNLRSIELTEEESGMLIYRRNLDSTPIGMKVFRLDTHLFPLWSLDADLERHFTYFHKGVERHGGESATQVFHLENAPSLYVSGRLSFRQYEGLLHNRFACITLLHEPYYELAERLMTLRHLPKYGSAMIGLRDMLALQPAIDLAIELAVDNGRLEQAFATMPGRVITLLSNPLARQLAADSFDAPAPRGAVATALSNLSTCMLLGIRERGEAFAEDLDLMLGLPSGSIRVPPLLGPVQALADRLRHIPEAEVLLEMDLDIYHQVRDVIEQTA